MGGRGREVGERVSYGGGGRVSLQSKRIGSLLLLLLLELSPCSLPLASRLSPLASAGPSQTRHTSLAKLRRAVPVRARVGRVVSGAAGRRGRRGRSASYSSVGGPHIGAVVFVFKCPHISKAGPAGEWARGRARLRVSLHLRPCGLGGEKAEQERERAGDEGR